MAVNDAGDSPLRFDGTTLDHARAPAQINRPGRHAAVEHGGNLTLRLQVPQPLVLHRDATS